MKIGYARVSTEERFLDLQLSALKNAGCDPIFSDHGTSGSAALVEFERALISERSNWASAAIMWKISVPPGDSVEMASVIDSKRIPRLSSDVTRSTSLGRVRPRRSRVSTLQTRHRSSGAEAPFPSQDG